LKISSGEPSKSAPDRKIRRIERIRPSPPDQALNKDATSTSDFVPVSDLKESVTVDSGNKVAPFPLTDIPAASEITTTVTDGLKDEPSKVHVATEIHVANQVAVVNKEAASEVSREKEEPEIVEVKSGADSKEIVKETLPEKGRDAPKLSGQQENKSESTPMKVQDQLDEVSSFASLWCGLGSSLLKACGSSKLYLDFISTREQLRSLI
jgi:hypothetical protein